MKFEGSTTIMLFDRYCIKSVLHEKKLAFWKNSRISFVQILTLNFLELKAEIRPKCLSSVLLQWRLVVITPEFRNQQIVLNLVICHLQFLCLYGPPIGKPVFTKNANKDVRLYVETNFKQTNFEIGWNYVKKLSFEIGFG